MEQTIILPNQLSGNGLGQIEPFAFVDDGLTISLRGLMACEEGWGNEQGDRVAAPIRVYLEVMSASIIRFSLRGVKRMDASFACALVRYIWADHPGHRFCLVDLDDRDLRTNWNMVAYGYAQPILCWNSQMEHCLLGYQPNPGLREAFQYILSVPRTSTSEVAEALNLKVQNASNKLKQLWHEGYIFRREQSAGSGGLEYEYARIK